MSRLSLLALPALVPAAVGSWLAARETDRIVALVKARAHEQNANVAAFGFSEAAGPAITGLSVTLLPLSVLSLILLARLLLAGTRRVGVLGYLPLLGCFVAGALLLAAARYNVAMATALAAVSHERTAPLATGGIAAGALGAAAGWLRFGALCAAALAVLTVLGPWRVRALCSATVLLGAVQLKTIQTRRDLLTDLVSRYYPAGLQVISVGEAHFAKRGLDPVLFVGPRRLYWRERGEASRELTSAELLSSPDCADKLRASLLGTAARSESSHFAVVLDEGTSYDGMLCVIRALQQPVPEREQRLRFAGDTLVARTLYGVEWWVRAPPQQLEPPFDVLAIEYGSVALAVRSRANDGESVVSPGPLARDVLIRAASVRRAVLLVADEGAVDAALPVFPEPVAQVAPSAQPSSSARVGRLTLGFGPPAVIGPIPPATVDRTVKALRPTFEACWHAAADGKNPYLEGRIRARFVIGRQGTVLNVSNGGSDLPDSAVTACVLGAFERLVFPPSPESIVTVVYSLTFTPL